MMYSDSMRMGPHNSIMDSTLVYSNYVVLFANSLHLDRDQQVVRFDKWYAYANLSDREQRQLWDELLELRKEIMPSFKNSIEGRDLAMFPLSLVQRMVRFVQGVVLSLKGIEPAKSDVMNSLSGGELGGVSGFEWPLDEGPEDSDEEMEEGGEA